MNFQAIPFANFKGHYVLLSDLTSMQDDTEKYQYPALVGEHLRLELKFRLPIEHVTVLIALAERMSLAAVDTFSVVGKNNWNGERCSPRNIQVYQSTKLSVPWFITLWLCSNSSQWHFCHYKCATQQYAWWSFTSDCKLLSKIAFCRFSWSWKLELSQAAVQADDARATPIPSQRLRFLHDLCSFPSVQVPNKSITGVQDVIVLSFLGNYK